MPGMMGVGRIGRFAPIQGGSDLYRLFANGEDGFLFGNFGDLTRLFTTSTGMTQVAADADPVGLALEDGRWQKRTLTQQLAQAAELLPNPSLAGAVSGVIGSGGALPTNWARDVDAGLTYTVTVGSGYIDLRMSGTTASTFTNILFAGNTDVVVSPGQELLSQYDYQRVAGANTNISSVSNNIYQRTSGGTFVSQSPLALTVDGSRRTAQLFSQMSGATVARANNSLSLAYSSGVAIDITMRIYAPSIKAIVGNHALQATGVQRPVYKPNSGKPYLSFDGSDDALVTPFRPTAALTLAVALRPTAGVLTSAMIGGGASGTSNRLSLGVGSGGVAARGWGNEGLGVAGNGAVDLRGSDHVLLLTGDATSVDLWADGGLVSSAAPSGSPGGGAGGIAVGCWNNNGTTTQFMTGFLYAALALNRRVTPAEVALITSKFRSTFQ